jgi:CarD family transcriptional regulator, regulator of rRNA transcription
MAARRKSTKKTATTLQKQRKTAAVRPTRSGAVKGRSIAKRSKPAAKPKERPASAKEAQKRSKKAKAASSSTRSRTKVAKRAAPHANVSAKTNKKGDRIRGTATTTSAPNPKRVEAKLQTKNEQKSKTRAAARVLAQEPGTAAAAPSGDKTTSSVSNPEVPVTKAAASASKEQKSASREAQAAATKAAKSNAQRQGFKLSEFVVYPAHGVGQIVAIEEQEVAGFKLELFVISFSKDKMTLRVPTSKGAGAGMRKISDPDTAKRSLEILTGRARVKRTMWSRRAQEYEAKINSGDLNAIAEVVRDLYRSDAQPEQSYSERQLYEAALDRMVREIAAVQKTSELDALRAVEAQLQQSHGRSSKATSNSGEAADPEIEEAA